MVLPWQSGTINFVGATIILVSVHQVLTLSFRLEYESGGLTTCGFLLGWYVGFFPQIIDPIRNPGGVAHGNCSRTAFRACSSSWLEKVSSLCLAFLLSTKDPSPWGPKHRVVVEPSRCPRGGSPFSQGQQQNREENQHSKTTASANPARQYALHLQTRDRWTSKRMGCTNKRENRVANIWIKTSHRNLRNTWSETATMFTWTCDSSWTKMVTEIKHAYIYQSTYSNCS